MTGAHPRAERVLGFHDGLEEAIQAGGVLAGIELMLLAEGLGGVIDQPPVPVMAAQLHVAVGRQRLHVAGGELQQGDVEGAAAEVVDHDGDLLRGGAPAGDR